MGRAESNCDHPKLRWPPGPGQPLARYELAVGQEDLTGGSKHLATSEAESISATQWATITTAATSGVWATLANAINATPAAPWLARVEAAATAAGVLAAWRASMLRVYGGLHGVSLASPFVTVV